MHLEIAAQWGRLSGEAEAKGRKIPVLDALIASTAMALGLTVITRNAKDMESTGVSLLDPWDL